MGERSSQRGVEWVIYIILYLTFLKIGLFSFGGGYAMIPMIQEEILNHGWLTSERFIDIIAIAQMTPGPIAVNAATFVGTVVAGVGAGILATLGVATPSLVLGTLMAKYHEKYKQSQSVKLIFYGIRPVVAGLILSAGLVVAKTITVNLDQLLELGLGAFNLKSILITAGIWLGVDKFKLDPIIAIIISAFLGIVLFYL